MSTISGTEGPDTIFGTTGNDSIEGLGGDDVIFGMGGADTINAGAGDDRITIDVSTNISTGELLNGGDGNDTLEVDSGPATPGEPYYSLTDATLSGIENIVTSGPMLGISTAQLAGVSSISGAFHFDDPGSISLGGISSPDVVVFTLNEAGNNLDLSGFTTFYDNVNGGASADTIIGSAAGEILTGGGGNDSIDGGGGNDTIMGGGGADTLTGGPGNDTFQDYPNLFNGDTITDFSPGDTIVMPLPDAVLAAGNVSFSISGHTLTYPGGSLTLSTLPAGHIVGQVVNGELELSVAAVRNDLSGDGRADVLFRNDSGAIFDFLGQANGGVVNNGDNIYTVVDPSWHFAGTGDFNGDGRADILWSNSAGQVFDFLGTANGGVANNGDNSWMQLPSGWSVAGVADLNGDGRADMLLRSSDGTITDYLANTSGGFADNSSNLFTTVDPTWHVVGTGDFNGDGKDDILWRNDNGAIFDFLGTANGGVVNNGDNIYTVVANSWHVGGVGDFNGDGRADILWSNSNGQIFDFLGTANGGVQNNGDNSWMQLPSGWTVVGMGDINGDGRTDILLRSSDGTITDYLANASGGFANNSANLFTTVDPSWHVQDNGIH